MNDPLDERTLSLAQPGHATTGYAMSYHLGLNPRPGQGHGPILYQVTGPQDRQLLLDNGVFVFASIAPARRAVRWLRSTYSIDSRLGLNAGALQEGLCQGPLAQYGNWKRLLMDEQEYFLVPSEKTTAHLVRLTLKPPAKKRGLIPNLGLMQI